MQRLEGEDLENQQIESSLNQGWRFAHDVSPIAGYPTLLPLGKQGETLNSGEDCRKRFSLLPGIAIRLTACEHSQAVNTSDSGLLHVFREVARGIRVARTTKCSRTFGSLSGRSSAHLDLP